MTTTTTTPTTSTSGPGTAPDPRPAFASAVETALAVIDRIRPDQFDDPTPCTEYDVRQLSMHLMAALNRIAVVGAGGSFTSTPDVVGNVADADVPAATRRFADQVAVSWADDAVLGRILELPWANLPGAVAMMIYVNEVIVHAWDLATATGQHPIWDDEVVGIAFAAIRRGLPAEGRAGEDGRPAAPFADVVPVADDAPLIDRLVAWNGRRP
ncbi:MAG: TIGR03086 family metal-binding protein [Ilumatobacteraceae bacterium]